MDNFDLKKYLVENKITKQSRLDENLSKFLNVLKDFKTEINDKVLKVQKNDDPKNHLEIYQAKDYKKSPQNL